jgi:hypothetical protein
MLSSTAYPLLLGVLLSAVSLSAQAVSQIRASGYTDLDGNFVRENVTSESEPNPPDTPFDRSIVSVQAGDLNGPFYYSASADIGLLELKVLGKIDNTAQGAKSNAEIGVLSATARLSDVISLQSDLSTPYDVIFELEVDGIMSILGGTANGFAQINFGPTTGADTFDSNFYNTNGAFTDTLSITRRFTGNVDADIGASLTFKIDAVDANAIITGAMNNTATLNLILPQGVSIAASESGTFGIPIAPVPLPSALPLFLFGLAATVVNGLRQKRGLA